MDGNGRWAKQRHMPRTVGHAKGASMVRDLVKACVDHGIQHLTLFAFSAENWRRPPEEVGILMNLFFSVLERGIDRHDRTRVRLRVVGERTAFDPKLQARIAEAESRTTLHSRLTLTICANYGGRWDIAQATRALLDARPALAQATAVIKPEDFEPYLALAYAPEPDLFIRTGGEQRISNFLLWQLAYTELFFTEAFWPDFDSVEFDRAIASYRSRERRFGRTSEQIRENLESPGAAPLRLSRAPFAIVEPDHQNDQTL